MENTTIENTTMENAKMENITLENTTLESTPKSFCMFYATHVADCVLGAKPENDVYRFDLDELLHDLSKRRANLSIIAISLDSNFSGEAWKINTSLSLKSLDYFNKTLTDFEIKFFDPGYHENFVVASWNFSRQLQTNLKSITLNLNFDRDTKLSFISQFRNVQRIDLSNNRDLGLANVLKKKGPVWNALWSTNSLQSLHLDSVQVIGMTGYSAVLDPFTTFNYPYMGQLSSLETLSLSNNYIGSVSHGITRIFPNLEALKLSRNLLLSVSANLPFLLEVVLLSDNIEGLNVGCQGYHYANDCDDPASSATAQDTWHSIAPTKLEHIHQGSQIPEEKDLNDISTTCDYKHIMTEFIGSILMQ